MDKKAFLKDEHDWNALEDELIDVEGRRFLAAFHLYLRDSELRDGRRYTVIDRHKAFVTFACAYPRAIAAYRKIYSLDTSKTSR